MEPIGGSRHDEPGLPQPWLFNPSQTVEISIAHILVADVVTRQTLQFTTCECTWPLSGHGHSHTKFNRLESIRVVDMLSKYEL